MVDAALLPLPFFLVMLYASLVPNGKNKHVGYVGAAAGLITFVLVWFAQTGSHTWFSLGNMVVSFSGVADSLSLIMVAVVAGIGTFVFFYSVGYFERGEDLRRFYALLSLFAWSMIGVVISDNLFQLFFFWELVGVSSFLLIGFWWLREEARKAARKAFLTIIVGDAFFLTGILVLVWQYGTFDIATILASLRPDIYTTIAGIGIIGGAISKSAQFPLHDWLADAMAGPTPVSAFLHSATMVKVGMFVIAKFLPLFVLAGLTPWIMLIAIITILLSGIMALVENDIKRVLAYSTMNQLGFILLAFSVGALAAGIFQLVTHSIFKALLFFAAGIIIHTTGTQDIRKIHIKWSWNLFNVSTLAGVLALAGIIPFAGFFSKEAIFESLINTRWELVLIFSVAIVMSSSYIFRWFFLMFRKAGKTAKGNWQLFVPLPILAVLALVAGVFGPYIFEMFNEHVFSILSITTIVSLALVGLGCYFAYMLFAQNRKVPWLTSSALTELARIGFMFDDLYTFFAKIVVVFARVTAWVDDAIINRFVRGMGSFTTDVSGILRKSQTGYVQTYVALIIIGFILLAVGVIL